MIRSYLASKVGKSPTEAYKMHKLRVRTWLEYEIAVIPISEISDDWERQTVKNIANRMYGGKHGS